MGSPLETGIVAFYCFHTQDNVFTKCWGMLPLSRKKDAFCRKYGRESKVFESFRESPSGGDSKKKRFLQTFSLMKIVFAGAKLYTCAMFHRSGAFIKKQLHEYA